MALRTVKNLIFLGALLSITSCNFKPQYNRPEMDVPENYRFAQEQEEKYANVRWWEQFQDPVLTDLIQTAIQNNQDLQVATARVLEFYAKYQVVFSEFFPQISLTPTVDRIKASNDVDFQPPSPFIPRINTLYQIFLQVSYELDFWGRIRNATESAKANYLAQIDARNTTILTIVSSVAKAYIQLLQFDYQLEISKLTYQSRLESWRIAKLRFEAGLVSEMEVKQAESEAEGAEVQIKNFEAFIPEQENLISVLIGSVPGPIPRGPLLKQLELPKVPVGLPSDLLQNRPDILQAEENMISANAQIGVARAAFFPKITLTGAQGQKSTDFDNFFKSSASAFDWGTGALQYLYTGGRLTGQLNEAEAIFLKTVHSYQQTVLTAFQEVSDALIAHQKAKEKLEVQTRQVAALEEYLRLAQLRYFNGQNDYLTVVDSEKNLFVVQLSSQATAADVFSTLIDLYKALGQGWDVEAPYCLPRTGL